MKPLCRQNNIETAKLLAELLPENVEGFLTFLETHTAQLVADPEPLRQQWDLPLISFDLWMRFARDVMTSLKAGGQTLAKKPALFAEQLFSGYGAVYCCHYLDLYTEQTACPSRFRAAITFLFHEKQ